MTTANTFETAAAALPHDELGHFHRGFCCMMDLPEDWRGEDDSVEVADWVNASITLWLQLALSHNGPEIMQRFSALPETLADLIAWAEDVEKFAGPIAKVEVHGDNSRLTLRWQENGTLVKLDVWQSKYRRGLHSRLMWDTGSGEDSQVLAAAGLNALLELAETRDILMDDEE